MGRPGASVSPTERSPALVFWHPLFRCQGAQAIHVGGSGVERAAEGQGFRCPVPTVTAVRGEVTHYRGVSGASTLWSRRRHFLRGRQRCIAACVGARASNTGPGDASGDSEVERALPPTQQQVPAVQEIGLVSGPSSRAARDDLVHVVARRRCAGPRPSTWRGRPRRRASMGRRPIDLVRPPVVVGISSPRSSNASAPAPRPLAIDARPNSTADAASIGCDAPTGRARATRSPGPGGAGPAAGRDRSTCVGHHRPALLDRHGREPEQERQRRRRRRR